MKRTTWTAVLIIVLVTIVAGAFGFFQNWGVNRENTDFESEEAGATSP